MPSLINALKGALIALPMMAHAAGQLGFSLGYSTGPLIDGKTADKDCKSTNEFVKDLAVIKKETGSNIIRTYTMFDCDVLGKVLPALKQSGGKAILGIWATPTSHFNKEVAKLEQYMDEYKEQIIGITVGSEALYREEETPESLAKKITTVKQKIGSKLDVPVGTADSWNLLIQDAANVAIEASDLILANAFSYWQGQKMENSTASFVDDIMQALAHVQKVKAGKDFQFWVGETNWPTGGANFEDAVPSVKNAAAYWKDAVCGMLQWGVNVFVFEAFDEPHKTAEKENDVEKYWGVMTEDRVPKFDLKC